MIDCIDGGGDTICSGEDPLSLPHDLERVLPSAAVFWLYKIRGEWIKFKSSQESCLYWLLKSRGLKVVPKKGSEKTNQW